MNLDSTYLRLRPDCVIEPLVGGGEFWQRLMTGALGDFHHEYLVTTSICTTDWPSWECHPNGDEIVLLVAGRITLHLESPGGVEARELATTGDFVLVPRGTWHTAKAMGPATLLFITAGEGTQTRPA